MSKTILPVVLSIVTVAVLLGVLSRPTSRRANVASSETQGGEATTASDLVDALQLFCAASNQAVLEEILDDYRAETGREVVVQYGASQTLLSQIGLSGIGDLYLPADDSYLDLADAEDLIAERITIATMRAGLAVRRDGNLAAETLDDLVAPGVRLVQASPDATAIGRLTKQVLQRNDDWNRLAESTIAFRGTVTEVANDVLVGAADAGIVYDAVLHTYDDLKFVPLAELADAQSRVAVAVLSACRRPAAALHLARYITARDRGLATYAQHGFGVDGGDAWSDEPELVVYAGSMLRPAIDDTITAFETREGIRVSRVYNGCGILVAQMHSGQRPDAYFACDTEFMRQVASWFPDAVNVSQNELVIIVPKGNPQRIGSLADLTKPGLRVGVGHEKQCAMGWLTQNTLKESGLQQELMENVTVQTPTGDMLVNQLRTGSLDAAVVYLSNAAGSGEYVDAVRIKNLSCAIANQPWAVATESPYPKLAARLFDRIGSADSRAAFKAEGFRWQFEAADADAR